MTFSGPPKQELSPVAFRQKTEGHTDVVDGVLHLPSGQRIITCSWDGSIRVWDLENGTQVGETWKNEGSVALHGIALSLNGTTVASGSKDGAVTLWDIDTGKVIKKWSECTSKVVSVCWSPDGGRVVSGSQDSTARVWNVESGEAPIRQLRTGNIVFTVCYSPDGKMIATGGTFSIKIWCPDTGELLKTLRIIVLCLAWTSDGKTVIAASHGRIRKIDTVTWTEIAVLDGHRASVFRVSLSPNNRIFASVSCDKTVRLWSLETGQFIGPPLHHEDIARCAAFFADGTLLTIGCEDNHIYTWDVSSIIREAGLENLLLHSERRQKFSFRHYCYTTTRSLAN